MMLPKREHPSGVLRDKSGCRFLKLFIQSIPAIESLCHLCGILILLMVAISKAIPPPPFL